MKFKKPKFWDYKKPNIYAYLLYPIAIIINKLLRIRIRKKYKKFKIKTICIGNFYLGGTGKTSLAIEINKILKKRGIKSCFIKKFYEDQRDEQKLLEMNGRLFLSSKRDKAIKKAEIENYEIAIIDDGLQDETINYDIKFVCFNNINWIGNGMTIPAGPLREKLRNLKNYKDIFLNGNQENLDEIKKDVKNINSEIKIHIGEYCPVNLRDFNLDNKFLVFSGIGNHKTFISMLNKYKFNILKDFEFPDHYNYSDRDINKIIEEAKNLGCDIITTEKDYVRINNLKSKRIKYIKSELNIINEEKLIKSIF